MTDATWIVGAGVADGTPLIMRFNDAACEVRESHPYRLGIAVALRNSAAGDEAHSLAELEDRLDAELAAAGAVAAFVITTGEMREFVFYAEDAARARDAVERVQTGVETHEMQWYVEPDPGWEAYEEFRPEHEER